VEEQRLVVEILIKDGQIKGPPTVEQHIGSLEGTIVIAHSTSSFVDDPESTIVFTDCNTFQINVDRVVIIVEITDSRSKTWMLWTLFAKLETLCRRVVLKNNLPANHNKTTTTARS